MIKVNVTADEALAYHLEPSPGKYQITTSKPLRTPRDLSLAYSPGVAHPVRAIAECPRNNRHSRHPHHCCDEIDDALEMNSPAVVACREPAEVLHSVEAPLDAIALFVGARVVRDDDLARPV